MGLRVKTIIKIELIARVVCFNVGLFYGLSYSNIRNRRWGWKSLKLNSRGSQLPGIFVKYPRNSSFHTCRHTKIISIILSEYHRHRYDCQLVVSAFEGNVSLFRCLSSIQNSRPGLGGTSLDQN